MLSRLRLAALIYLAGASLARADVTLTFTAPAVATPQPMTAKNGVIFNAYTAALSGYGSWSPQLQTLLIDYSFTPEMTWLYGPFAKGLPEPLTLANNARFNVTTYRVTLGANRLTGGEDMVFNLNLGNTAPPTLAGATVTPHWLQILHTSMQVNDFGFSIPGTGGGYWQIDNGQVLNNTGSAGPFYDSNQGPDVVPIVPPTFDDDPHDWPAILGLYVQFWALEAWDVFDGSQHYLVVSDQAVYWGFYTTPEPSSLALAGMGMLVVVAARARAAWVRRWGK